MAVDNPNRKRHRRHFMPWAPEDWRGSSIRGYAVMNGDHVLRITYLELLFYFWTHGGTHPSDPLRVAATVGIPLDDAARTVAALVVLGALDEADGLLSNVRVTSDLREDAEFREERAKAGSKGGQKTTSAQANASSAQAQLKQTQAQPDPPSPSPSPSPREEEKESVAAPPRRPVQKGSEEAERLLAVWNANRGTLPAAKMTDGRKAKARQRLAEEPDLGVWERAVRTLASSPFHTGTNDRGWVATFDFILQPSQAGLLDKARSGSGAATLTAKEKWQKVSPAEAAEWVRIDAMREQERLESRAHYREILPTLDPEKITRLLTVILPETDPEFAAELSAEGYR